MTPQTCRTSLASMDPTQTSTAWSTPQAAATGPCRTIASRPSSRSRHATKTLSTSRSSTAPPLVSCRFECCGWSELQKLCDYVYSLYSPPDDHLLNGRTISWSESNNLGPRPGHSRLAVDIGIVISVVGHGWGRWATVSTVRRDGLPPIVIKEDYLPSGCVTMKVIFSL
ncbi:hypothetical protein BD413DRAFT_34955 [Trametes elegans]|nr:hypothetical protein BD413DRAFT_34955 [Trametes elegans]